jgi:5-methylcytosine-specific restriction endonuclease McrA
MWFENSANRHMVDGGLLYPLRQTALRRNVQIQLSKLERLLRRRSEFLIVIHNGADTAYYIPYSWLQRKVLPKVRVRRRPYEPTQRYLTVDELRTQTHKFSFGLNRNGNPLRFDLSEFLNVASSASELTAFLVQYKRTHRVAFPEFSPKDGPFILARQEAETRYNVSWPAPQRGRLPPLLRALRKRRFRWSISGNNLVITHPEAKADASNVVDLYTQLLESGRISASHVTTEAKWRPYQRSLRDACLNIYGYHCAMCDVDIRSALTASHIKPASLDRRNRTNLRNVLLLCQLHDSLFERRLITVRPDYAIACSPKLESSSRLIQDWVFGIEGRMITRPSRYPPDPSFLSWHARKSGVSV